MQATTEPADASGSLRRRILLALAIALAPLCLYWPILSHGFVYDDVPLVATNPLITGFDKIPQQFSSALLDNLEPEQRARVGYWRPFTSMALTLGHVLGGGSPRALHALSIVAHMLATLAAFALAWRITRATFLAAFTALFFALHPAQVESVAWISAINSMLFGALTLFSLERFLAWRERGSRGLPLASGALFLAALLSKEIAVAALPCALALDLWRRGAPLDAKTWSERLDPWKRAYAPFVAAFALYYLARVAVFHDAKAGFDLHVTHLFLPARRMVLMRFELLGGMLGLLGWPASLNLFRPIQPDLRAFSAGMLPAWIAIAATAVLFFNARRLRWTIVLAGLAFTLAALLPMFVRIESMGMFPLADRYLYLAAFGFALTLAWLAQRFLPGKLACVVLGALAVAYGWRSFVRLHSWKDDETVFARAAQQSPRSPYVQWNYGRLLFQRYHEHAGDPLTRDTQVLARAQAQFENALELADAAQKGDESIFATVNDFIEANIGLGWCELSRSEIDGYGDFETPLAIFKGVVTRYPDSEIGHHAVAVALQRLGRFDEAETELRKATELNPRYASAWHNLGKLHVARSNWKAAIADFERALEIRPGELRDLAGLAGALADSGDAQGAQRVLEQAIARHPDAAQLLVLRAKVAAQQQHFDAALEDVRRALELEPENGDGLLLKGLLHARVKEFTAAERAITRAAELMPESFAANYNAASLLLQGDAPRVLEALPFLLHAYAQRPPGASGDALEVTLRNLPIGDADLLWELASSDVARGSIGKASAWLERALAVKSDHGPSHYLQGVLAERRGEHEAAIELWKKACVELPQGFQVRQELGTLLSTLGRHAEALPYLEAALKLGLEANAQDPQAAGAIEALKQKLEEVRAKAR